MKRKIMVGLLCSAMLLSLAGCKKDGTILTETSMSQMIVNTEGLNLAELSNSLYVVDGDATHSGYEIKTRMLYVTSNEAVADLTLSDIGDRIDSFHLGTFAYTVDELLGDENDGDKILARFNQDFGIKKYDEEMNYVSTPGCVSEEALYTEDAYSFTITNNGRTGRVYFFDVHLSSMTQEVQDQCIELYAQSHENNDCINLNGKLSLIVYEDTEGNPAGYEIGIQAPVYYDTYDNFAANMDVAVRFDITNCSIYMNDGTNIGSSHEVSIIR